MPRVLSVLQIINTWPVNLLEPYAELNPKKLKFTLEYDHYSSLDAILELSHFNRTEPE